MKKTGQLLLAAFSILTCAASVAQEDSRQFVELPPMMSQHMLANMRDHLMAINTIQQALADADFDSAADAAEKRLGFSSLTAHGAAHMAPYMPQPMQEIGTGMHRAASRFAVIAQESAVDGNMQRAIGALAQVTRHCVACHNGFRTR